MKVLTRLSLVLMFGVLALGVASLAAAQGGLPVATLACEQYLRSQPATTSEPLAVVFADEPMMLVTGRDLSGGWFVVLRQNGQIGWMGASDCLRIRGNVNNAPLTLPAVYDGPPIATVACTQYVRATPANDGTALMVLYPEDGVISIIGRSETSPGWFLIQTAREEIGWVFDTPCIRMQGDPFQAPISVAVMPVPGPDGTIPGVPASGLPRAQVSCTQYVRSAPTASSPALIILWPDDSPLEIIGRDTETAWLLIRRADGAMGWVSPGECVRTQDDLSGVPYAVNVIMPVPGVSAGSAGALIYPDQMQTAPVRPTFTLPEPYVTLGCPNYVRSAANNEAARLAIFHPGGDPLEILARDKPGEWLLVRRWDGAMGWVVNTRCVVVHGNVFVVPEDTSVVMPIPGVTNGNMDAVPGLLANSQAPAEFAPPAPVQSVELPPEPFARLSCPNYVRSAANNESARLAIVYPGDDPLEILARDQPAAWLLVRWSGGMGWVVNTACIKVVGNVFDAPQDTSVVMPVPTPEPTAAPLPFPGAPPPADWPPAG